MKHGGETARKRQVNEQLRKERLLRGWSFKEVAAAISCPDERLVRRWEHGDVFPSPAYRQKLCLVFQKNAEELGLLRIPSLLPADQTNQETNTTTSEQGSQRQLQEQEMALGVVSGNPSLEENSFIKEPAEVQQPWRQRARDRNRQRMLERVKYIWITGVLEPSLKKRALIPLIYEEDPQLVNNPWRSAFPEIDHPAQTLHCSQTITQIYDASHEELLILGEPGSGKTTALLLLARDLLARAMEDERYPLPVIFHLASWSSKKQPFAFWLVEELRKKYQVPRHIGQDWIAKDKLLLLCDGLDEGDGAVDECIAAINEYREEHGFVSLVLCSRLTEYCTQHRRLLVKNAICIQPLTAQQVDTYLAHQGEALLTSRLQFSQEGDFQQLLTTPLLLTLFLDLSQDNIGDCFFLQEKKIQYRQLFHVYVQYMFQRRPSRQNFPSQQSLLWLSWLAKRMKRQQESIFFVESLQFTDLTGTSRLRSLPVWLFGIILAGFGWLQYGLFFGAKFGWLTGVVEGGVMALCACFLYVLVNRWSFKKTGQVSPLSSVSQEPLQKNREQSVTLVRRYMPRLLYALSFGFPLGMLVSVLVGIFSTRGSAIAHGGYNFFILTFDFALLGKCPERIQPVETVICSWSHLRRYLLACVMGGGMLSLVLWLFFLTEFETGYAFFLALLFGSGFVFFLGGSIGIVAPGSLDRKHHLRANEGIARSFRNSLILGGCCGILAGGSFFLLFTFFGHPQSALVAYGIIPAISSLQIIGLRNGGYAWIQHLAVRFLLWRTRALPWKTVAFLDYAVERMFLQKVGGGYMFLHSFLLDYFANLPLLPETTSHSITYKKCCWLKT